VVRQDSGQQMAYMFPSLVCYPELGRRNCLFGKKDKPVSILVKGARVADMEFFLLIYFL
jgi:hypothetical protein